MRGGKYEHLIEPDLWAYIDEVNRWYPPEVVDLPIADQRAIYDAMCAAFHSGRPAGVEVRDRAIDLPDRSIPLRIYHRANESSRARLIYLHGGGFVLGGLDSHDDICAELCSGTGYDVISVDYRLAPEQVHPSAFDDARCFCVDRRKHDLADRTVRRECGRQSCRRGSVCLARRPIEARRPGSDLSRARRG